ncbi:MAG TPA: KH domain-containing protein [Candidatus Nitrosopolaris sp.]|nr:KH domain-containing protein [Candidatus Nitrosopolaris sp.]
MAASIDQQFIEYIIKSIVNKPDAVKIDRRVDEKGVLLELTVDQEDLGRVIGKRGATAQSLRTLLRALGTKNDVRYNLKIIDVGPPPAKRDDSATVAADQPVKTDEPLAKAPVKDDQAAKPADDIDITEDEELPEAPSVDHSSVIDKTRKELAELDDLDV